MTGEEKELSDWLICRFRTKHGREKSHNMQKFRFTVRLQSRHFYEGFNYAFIKEKFVTRPNDVYTRGQVNYKLFICTNQA